MAMLNILTPPIANAKLNHQRDKDGHLTQCFSNVQILVDKPDSMASSADVELSHFLFEGRTRCIVTLKVPGRTTCLYKEYQYSGWRI